MRVDVLHDSVCNDWFFVFNSLPQNFLPNPFDLLFRHFSQTRVFRSDRHLLEDATFELVRLFLVQVCADVARRDEMVKSITNVVFDTFVLRPAQEMIVWEFTQVALDGQEGARLSSILFSFGITGHQLINLSI
jgi:hypothetical protein